MVRLFETMKGQEEDVAKLTLFLDDETAQELHRKAHEEMRPVKYQATLAIRQSLGLYCSQEVPAKH